MGCDIHASVEFQEHGQWYVAFRCEHLDRWYALFGRLVPHVRAPDETPVAEARGLPDDCATTRWHAEEYPLGDHTFSWLTKDELALALDLPVEMGSAPPGYLAVLEAMRVYEANGVPTRFVFGFDS